MGCTALAGLSHALAGPDVRGVAVYTAAATSAQQIRVTGSTWPRSGPNPEAPGGRLLGRLRRCNSRCGAACGSPPCTGPGAAWLRREQDRPRGARTRPAHTLMTAEAVVIKARPDEETSPVRIPGAVARGPLLGGNTVPTPVHDRHPDMPDLRGGAGSSPRGRWTSHRTKWIECSCNCDEPAA